MIARLAWHVDVGRTLCATHLSSKDAHLLFKDVSVKAWIPTEEIVQFFADVLHERLIRELRQDEVFRFLRERQLRLR